MIELMNKNFNSKDYTLVDEYDDIIENRIIYHFSSEEDDLFCFKINDEYEIITDEKIINLVKESYELFSPEILFKKESQDMKISTSVKLMAILNKVDIKRKLNHDEKTQFYDVQIERLKKLGGILDFSKLKERLMSSGDVYFCNGIDDGRADGIYHCASDSIYLFEKISFDDPIFLHETIHKATGPFSKMPLFLKEGGAESIVQKVYERKISSERYHIKDKQGVTRRVKYNFYSTYAEAVSLVRQIEHAVGFEADKDLLNGTTNILDEFSRKYGKDVMLYVRHAGLQLTRSKSGLVKGNFERFVKAQNLILERVFDKDFPKEMTIENAQEYLTRLQGMELHRGRIEGDKFFEEFYQEKYKSIKQMLLEKGYELAEIEKSIHEYTPIEFYPTRKGRIIRESPTSEAAKKFLNTKNITSGLSKENEETIEQEDLKRYVLKTDDFFVSAYVYKNNIYAENFARADEERPISPRCYKNIGMERNQEDYEIIYFDSESNTLKFCDQDGQIYDLEEIPVQEEIIEDMNARLKCLREFRENAMMQRESEIQETKGNLFQRIKDWLNLKKDKSKTQEVVIKDANDQR